MQVGQARRSFGLSGLPACLALAKPKLPEWCDRWQITCRLRTSSALKVWLAGFRWEVVVDRRFEMRASRERRDVSGSELEKLGISRAVWPKLIPTESSISRPCGR
jgi:hypothetical protein